VDSSNYYFNPYSIPLFITAFLVMVFGLYVFMQDRSLIVNKSFLIVTISASIWQAGMGVLYITKDPTVALSFYQVFTHFGVVTIAPGIYLLTVASLDLFEKKKKYVIINYTIAIFFYIIDLTTNWFSVGIAEHFWGKDVSYSYIMAYPFLIFFSILVISSFHLYYNSLKKMEAGAKRDQIKLLMLSLAIAVFGAVDFVVSYSPFEVYPFGYLPVLIFIFLQTYAIIKYQKSMTSEIFNAIEDGIIMVDRNASIIKINPSAEKIIGIDKKDMLGKNILKVFSSIEEKLEQPKLVIDILTKIINRTEEVKDEDVSFLNPNKYINIISTPLLNRFGVKTGNIITLRDITQRKNMENELRLYKEELEKLVEERTQELKKSEEKYRALVEHAQVGIGIHRDGKMVFANKQFISMLGYTQEEFIGIPISQLIHPDEVKVVMARAYDRYSGKDVIESYDVQLLKKDGSIMPTIINNVIIEYEGEKSTLITVVDITDAKMRKELELVNKELEMFAYSISHDLRAPLRSINGFSQALLEDYEDKLDEEGKDYLLRLRAASQRMSVYIDAILKLSRLGRAEVKQEEIDLSALVQDIAKDLKESEPARDVEFIIEEGVTAIGDRTLLRVVLENLVGNAWKFTSNQENAKIEFGIYNSKPPIYFVRDNGCGFDMKYIDKLFTPFQRLHSDAEFEGTGVGLASSQRIIRRHGGNIWAESAVGKGATFYFTLRM